MAKSTSQRRAPRRPARGPTKRAIGLDPEFTAQPRVLPDDVGRETAAEPGLSIDPDELGNAFLREATQQGDFEPSGSDLEMALMEDPTGDEPPLGSYYEPDASPWDQTVDLSLRNRDASGAYPAPTLLTTYDDDDDETTLEMPTLHIAQSTIREVSLLDREGREGDETDVPDIDAEDGGRHARSAPRGELGEQVEAEHPAAHVEPSVALRLVAKATAWLRRFAT